MMKGTDNAGAIMFANGVWASIGLYRWNRKGNVKWI